MTFFLCRFYNAEKNRVPKCQTTTPQTVPKPRVYHSLRINNIHSFYYDKTEKQK